MEAIWQEVVIKEVHAFGIMDSPDVEQHLQKIGETERKSDHLLRHGDWNFKKVGTNSTKYSENRLQQPSRWY